MPENRQVVGVLVGAEKELSAWVELEVPRSAALGVAVVSDGEEPALRAGFRVADGEHGNAVVTPIAHQNKSGRFGVWVWGGEGGGVRLRGSSQGEQ